MSAADLPLTASSPSLPLRGVRVLETGDTLALAYLGKLLVDLGADVVKFESHRGDPLRAVGPFLSGIPSRELSGSFAYFNSGKKSVCLSPSAALAETAGFARRADVIIRSSHDGADWLSDELAGDLKREYPGVIVCDISTYGRQPDAVASGSSMSDLLALAASGMLGVSASDPMDARAAPLRYRGELASICAACNGAIAILGALADRLQSGQGQHLDISAQASVAAVLGTRLSRFSYTGQLPIRHGTHSVSPCGFYDCFDGKVFIQCTEDRQWQGLISVLGDPEWGALEAYETTEKRVQAGDTVDALVREAIGSFTTSAFLKAASEFDVPSAPIQSGAEILAWDHLQARGFFKPIAVSDGRYEREISVPGLAWRYHSDAGAALQRGRSPRLGSTPADADAVWPEVVPDQAPGIPRANAGGPLAGTRVIDLTWAWAGPVASRYLAHLGAEVIKIENVRRMDVTRRLGPYADDQPGVNRSGYFNQYSQGKKSVCIDLKNADGVNLLKSLIRKADVVIDNLRAGALERIGLSYSVLRELNPKIIAVSITGFGETGPARNRVAYGAIIDALSGAAAANGDIGGGPTDLVLSMPDPITGMHAAIATVAALLRARQTGNGERVECAMIETCIAAFPWSVLFHSSTGQEAPVIGNRDELRSPHGVYPCGGEDRWLAIAVATDAQFVALCEAIGRPDLAQSERFRDLWSRRVHEDDLDGAISAWSRQRDVVDAASALRQAGVPVEVVMTAQEVFNSPALRQRQFFIDSVHPEIGVKSLPGVDLRGSRSLMRSSLPPPLLGQHTRSVLRDLLGLPEGEIDRLEQHGVVA
jgi:crotonobetainyl-CoA:carnitine CoA-transferase CaiB-like acyl-CoA transferase